MGQRLFLIVVVVFSMGITALVAHPAAQNGTCEIESFDWIPQSDRLLVGSAEDLAVYDVNNPDQPQQRFEGIRLRPTFTFHRFDSTNRLYLTDHHVVDLETGDVPGEFPDSTSIVTLNGDTVVLAGDGVFVVRTGERLLTTPFMPRTEGNLVYSGGMVDGEFHIYVYDLLEPETPAVVINTGLERLAWNIRFSDNLTRLAIVEPDDGESAVHLYDLQTGAQIAILESAFPVSRSANFFDGGRYLFIHGSSPSGTYIWDYEYGFRIWNSSDGELLFDAPFGRIVATTGETVIYAQERQPGAVEGYFVWRQGADAQPIGEIQPLLANSRNAEYRSGHFVARTPEGFGIWTLEMLIAGEAPLVLANLPASYVDSVRFSDDLSRALVFSSEDTIMTPFPPAVSVTLYDVANGNVLLSLTADVPRNEAGLPEVSLLDSDLLTQYSGANFALDRLYYSENGNVMIHSAVTGEHLYTLQNTTRVLFNSDETFVAYLDSGGVVHWLRLADGMRGSVCRIFEE